ncbi:MAG: PucR family transcriptional regulator ligand-binding domain-containing protein [Treponema sp.]|nr:PucR family transcriptional regulator ligand-binding domain-containing protein [Treponema sp.]
MITVNEILNLTLFKKFNILTGKEYLSNTVTTAVILEYESSRIQYAGYCYGYFVLVSYFFASTNPELVNGSIKNLIKKHVSGIAIKLLPQEKLPEDIISLAKENRVPILTFYEEFMEDLIININESMKTRSQYIINEEKLNMIMTEKKDKDQVQRIALEINPNFKEKIISASLISKEAASNLQVHTYFDKLMYHRSKLNNETDFSFIKLGYSIILICSFSEEETSTLFGLSNIKDILVQNGFNPSSFFIGYSAEPVDLSNLKESVHRAEVAANVCQFNNRESLSYKYIGIYKYVISLINDEILCKEIVRKIAILEDYDNLHEANLIRTLISFVNNNGDYSAASKECYQHTNTIRYRIKKAEQLLDLEESTALEEITLLIRCYFLLKYKH